MRRYGNGNQDPASQLRETRNFFTEDDNNDFGDYFTMIRVCIYDNIRYNHLPDIAGSISVGKKCSPGDRVRDGLKCFGRERR